MRVGQHWTIYFYDHFDGANRDAWTAIEKLDIEPPVLRAAGFVVKHDRKAVALAVCLDGGSSTNPFTILRSTIVAKHQTEIPPYRNVRAAMKRRDARGRSTTDSSRPTNAVTPKEPPID